MEEDGNQKKHRKRQAGPKAEKKKAKNKHQQELTPQQRNPKAFAIQHAQKTAKLIRRFVGEFLIRSCACQLN